MFICVCSSCTVNQIKFILFNKIEWTSSLSTVQIIVNANKRAKVSTWEMRREQQQKGQQQAYDIVTFHSHPYILYVYLYRVSIFAINILCHVLKISSQTFNGFSNSSWTFDFVECESGGDWRAKWYGFMQTSFYRERFSTFYFIFRFHFGLTTEKDIVIIGKHHMQTHTHTHMSACTYIVTSVAMHYHCLIYSKI